jgi:hypothetical protein
VLVSEMYAFSLFLSHIQLDPVVFVLRLRAQLLMKLSIHYLFFLAVT